MEIIDAMLTKGASSTECADKIQNDWGLYGDVKTDTLRKQITRYYKEMVKPYLKTLVPAHKKTDTESKVDPVKPAPVEEEDDSYQLGELLFDSNTRDIDPVTALENLLELQNKRLAKIMEREEGLPLLLKEGSEAITQMQSLLGQYSNLKMDLGLLHRVPRKHLLEAPRELEALGRESHQSSVKDQDEVRKAAARVMELIHGGKGGSE